MKSFLFISVNIINLFNLCNYMHYTGMPNAYTYNMNNNNNHTK